MTFRKVFLLMTIGLFGFLGIYAMFGGKKEASEPAQKAPKAPAVVVAPEPAPLPVREEVALPDADRMDEFFNTGLPKLPIMETVTYSSRVPWLKGKSAWVSDYAAHFGTSRHLIARSLHGTREYDRQEVMNGDRFNVFREEVPVSFHLVVDTSRCKMWVYYLNEESDERVLVKTYPVGIGRPEERRMSGSLTPWGVYSLGDRIAVYRPGTMGQHNRDQIEMMTVFGTRWIPFDEEVENCTAPARGLGMHGCPWRKDPLTGRMVEDASGLEQLDSDGCIRLQTEDMEELFAVIITKPTKIYLVPDFFDARLPGKER